MQAPPGICLLARSPWPARTAEDSAGTDVAHRYGPKLGHPAEGFAGQDRDVFVHIPHEFRVQVVHVVLPNADHKLGGHVTGGSVRRFDTENEPATGHGRKSLGSLVGRQARSFGDSLCSFQPHGHMNSQGRFIGSEQAF
jgi:hypothetical protein